MRAMTPIVVTLRAETSQGFGARNDKQNAHVARLWCAWCDEHDGDTVCGVIARESGRSSTPQQRWSRRDGGGYWMPACAGMTGGEAVRRVGWCAA